MDYRIQEIIEKIENDFPRTMTVNDSARYLNISVSYFQHLFKQEVGKSFTRYIKELRLRKACEFLEKTHMRIKEIRVKIGISDDVSFSREFKKKFGYTPSNYRKKFRDSRNS